MLELADMTMTNEAFRQTAFQYVASTAVPWRGITCLTRDDARQTLLDHVNCLRFSVGEDLWSATRLLV